MDKYLSYLRAKLRGKVDLVVTQDIIARPEGQVATKGDTVDTEKYLHLFNLNLNSPLHSSIKIAKPLSPLSIGGFQESCRLMCKNYAA
jgi:hypothetical protein